MTSECFDVRLAQWCDWRVIFRFLNRDDHASLGVCSVSDSRDSFSPSNTPNASSLRAASAESRAARILYIEDDPTFAAIALQIFAQAGLNIEHSANGLDAFERLHEKIERFDVVITDHRLPGITGVELVELLRQANYAGKIVVYSSQLTKDEIAQYHSFGVKHILTKSARIDDLLKVI